MPLGFYIIMAAQFFSALADNAAHVRHLEGAWRQALALAGVQVSP